MRNSKNIVLIGFMGTGKTSVGKFLASKLHRELVDIDRMIEERQKRKIGDIFEKEGEAYFRTLEKEAVREVSQKEGAVITTGGGVVLDPENLESLKKNGTLIALTATPQTIFKRVKYSRTRPLLKGDKLLPQIERLYNSRRIHYEKADLHFATDGCTPSEVTRRILEALKDAK